MFTLSSILLFGGGNAFAPNIYVYMVFNFLCGFASVVVMSSTVMGTSAFPILIIIYIIISVFAFDGIFYW